MGRLAITKRYSLASVGDGWEECYLSYTPATYGDFIELRKLDTSTLTEESAWEYQRDFCNKRIVDGTVLEMDGTARKIVPFRPEHLEQFTKVLADSIFNAISGVTVDPKGEMPTQA